MNKVSVIIPLYNREALVLETINSLRNQVFENWEAIIVDDESTDNSYNVVENFAEQDKRIKLFKRNREPKGAPTCRNIGIEKASGKYIIFLDSDDLLAPYSLEERLNSFQTSKDVDFLVFNSSFFTDIIGDTAILWNKFTDEDDLNRYLRGDTVWCISSPIWKREAILKNKLQFIESAQSSQDWEFHVNALFKKMTYEKIDGLPDFFVRRNSQQAINAISSSHGNFDMLINRVELYKELVESYKFSEEQCKLLFAMIEKELFNSYRNFSFEQLKILCSTIQSVNCVKRENFKFQPYWYGLLSIGSKLTFNKSHQLIYYFKRHQATNKKRSGYRSAMPNDMYLQLNQKLDTFKSTTVEK